MASSNLHITWARLLIKSFVVSGIKNIVLSPGSRSTPLALAVAELEEEQILQCHIFIDERVAAFFALGQARVTHKPTLLICTSGTAGAHYLPAIIEASMAYLPMIAITADRPWELYNIGASQTIDQVKMYGNFVRQFFDLGLPDTSPSALQGVLRIAQQSVYYSQNPTPGPVHINARFRKPLEPIEISDDDASAYSTYQTCLSASQKHESIHSHVPLINFRLSTQVNQEVVNEITHACRINPKGLIVCGPSQFIENHEHAQKSIAALSQATGFPVLAESTSQMRFGLEKYGCAVSTTFDFWMRSCKSNSELSAQIILEFGSTPVSSGYQAYRTNHPNTQRYTIASYGWNDPDQSAIHVLNVDPYYFARQLALELKSAFQPDQSWRNRVMQLELELRTCIQQHLAHAPWAECLIARILSQEIPDGSTLMIGNSNPVRDLDRYAESTKQNLCVLHQRGASGIDGFISAAAGSHSMREPHHTAPTVVLLGDLSALHDVGGFYAIQQVPGGLIVIVIQNQGGRIFEQLPIGKSMKLNAQFERFFTTPQNIDFEAIAHLACMHYERVQSSETFRLAFRNACIHRNRVLIEAVVDPTISRNQREQIAQLVSQKIAMHLNTNTP